MRSSEICSCPQLASWVDSLKVAVLTSDVEAAFRLTQSIPAVDMSTCDDEALEQMRMSLGLISQVVSMLEKERENVRMEMSNIKVARRFLS